MADIRMTLSVSDAELRRLQAIAGEEPVADYAARVGLKGLRGALEAHANAARQRAIGTLMAAYDAAAPELQAQVVDLLGYTVGPTGELEPKPR